MRPLRLFALTVVVATGMLALGGCGLLQTSAPASEPVATIASPIAQTVYTAVGFVGKDGMISAYEQPLVGQAPAAPATAAAPPPNPGKLLSTRDGGRTWHATSLGNWQVDAIDMVTHRVGYLAADDPDVGYAVLRTADGGRSWREVLPLTFSPTFLRASGAGGLLVLAGGNLYATEDGGRHWRSVHPDVPGIVAASFPTVLRGYALTGLGILETEDGGVHWRVRYTLPQGLVAQLGLATGATIDVEPQGGFAAFTFANCWPSGCPHVVLRIAASGDWQIVSGEDAGPLPTVTAPEDGFAGGAQQLWTTGPDSVVWNGAGGLWQSTDAGASWQEIGAPKAHQPSPAFVDVSGVRSGDLWAIGQDVWGGYLLHRTAVGWQQVLPQPFPVSAVDFVTDRVGYGIGLSWSPRAIVGTRDGGRTWHVLPGVGGGLPVALSFTSPEHGYLATAGISPTLWQTADGGRSWQVVGAFAAPPVSLAFSDPRHGAALFATGPGWPLEFALAQTEDGGRTWTTEGLPDAFQSLLTNTTPTVVTSTSALFPTPDRGYLIALVQHVPQLWGFLGSRWQAIAVPGGTQARGNGTESFKGVAMSSPGARHLWLALQPNWSQAQARIMRLGPSGWQLYDLPAAVSLDLPQGSGAVSAFGDGRAVILTNLGPLETEDGGQTWRLLAESRR